MEIQLKKAFIVSSRSAGKGNFFSVRIVPDMQDIQETDLLPLYPTFFREKDIAYKAGESVWVACSEDFEVGFILGYDVPPAGSSIDSFVSRINSFEQLAGLPQSGYNSLTLIRMSGKSIHFENTDTGTAGVIYDNGSSYIFGDEGSFFFRPARGNLTVKVSTNGDAEFTGHSITETYKEAKKTIKGASKESVSGFKESYAGSSTTRVGGKARFHYVAEEKMVTGDSVHTFIGKRKINLGIQGQLTSTVVGNVETEVGAGFVKTEVKAGGIENKVLAGTFNLTVVAGALSISAPNINISGNVITTPSGFVAPTGSGGLCALPVCLFTGAPHVGNVLTGI